jgi:predicted esterase YcpF (UPF0227 family)
MIINIHGFNGRWDNSKYRWFCANAGRHNIYSPAIDYPNEKPHDILNRLLDRISLRAGETLDEKIYVLGSSLGGFFARRINQICPFVTAILINPSLAPFLTQRRRLDRQGYLDLTAKYAYMDDDPSSANLDKLNVIIGDSDELIDHEKLTLPLLPPDFSRIYTIRGGAHQIEITEEVHEILKSIILYSRIFNYHNGIISVKLCEEAACEEI